MSAHRADHYDADDMFEGAGGWAEGARMLGITTRGYEIWAPAVATARAAGHDVVQVDVREIDPATTRGRGLIASPPCQTFSMAGKGSGRAALDRLIKTIQTGWWYPEPGDDERTTLVLEPYRWIAGRLRAGRPYEWIAFEQVAPVLPVWEAYAEWLRGKGYGVATGVLSAEQYGVGQTRKRAVLAARLQGEARLPEPTHSRYYSRTPEKLDAGLLRWRSMAEVLAWGMTARPGFAVTVGTDAGGTDPACVGGSGARRALYGERAAGRWRMGDVRSSNGAVRDASAPAPTITGSADNGNFRWVSERPATTVSGDPRIWPPGHKVNAADRARLGDNEADARYGDRAGTEAIRVSAEEAAALQSFPPGYPWQGNKGEVFQQIGNAVPPLLARAVLAAVALPSATAIEDVAS